MSFTGRLLFDNWRNKLVALIFAVSIWFIAFQSENRTFTPTLSVELRPEDPERKVIVASSIDEPGIGRQPISGRVVVTFSGPRKQIDILRERLRRQYTVTIPPDIERYELREADFGFPRDGVSVTKIDPPIVFVRQEPLEEVTVTNLRDRVQVTGVGSDVEVATEVVRPDTLRWLVPSSQSKSLSVRIPIERPKLSLDEPLEELVAPQLVSIDPDLVARFVKVWDADRNRWVSAKDPPKVLVRVTLRESSAQLDREDVRIDFRVPLLPHPYRILLHDEPDGAIPLRFIGPSSEIRRLESAFAERPSFAVVVPLPPLFDPAKGGVFTFGEDAVEVPGFPRIKVAQHQSRIDELKGAWSYEVKVYPEGEAGR